MKHDKASTQKDGSPRADMGVTIDAIFKTSSRHRKHHKEKTHRDRDVHGSYFWEIDQMTIPTINNNKIRNLHIKPGKSPFFIYYFIVSCYIPIITSVLGPISHMFSIACLVNKWRTTKGTKHEINDTALVLILNCVALFTGGVSNVVLLLHFSGRIPYLIAQKVNILGWSFSGLLLLIDMILFKCIEFDSDIHEKSIGFWFAVYTCILNFLCAFLLMVHLIGHRKGKYKATFNLSHDERAVMLYTFGFSLWLMWGAWLYSKCLFVDISYGVSLYALLCGALTVGFGDIYSPKTSGRIISMFYFLSSIVIIGLIISMTSLIIRNTFQPIIHLHLCERARIKAVKKIEGFNEQFDTDTKSIDDDSDAFFDSGDMVNKDSFAYYAYKKGNNYTDVMQFTTMRKLHIKYRKLAKASGFITAMVLFFVFWLTGAVIFKFSEGWDYFDSMYFAFLDCLLTIGYGDFVLTSASSHAFFVLFALAAIPLMTSLINAIGDSLSSLGWSFIKYVVLCAQVVYTFSFGVLDLTFRLVGKRIKMLQPDEGNDTFSKRALPFSLTVNRDQQLKEELDDLLQISFDINALKQETQRSKYEYHWLEACSNLSKNYELLSHTSPDYKLTFQEWIDFFKLSFYSNKDILHEKHFWLSNESPIRFDTNEPRFVYLQLTHLIAEHVKFRKNEKMEQDREYIDPHVLGRNGDDDYDLQSEISDNNIHNIEEPWSE